MTHAAGAGTPTTPSPDAAGTTILELRGAERTYRQGRHIVHALRTTDLHVLRGEFTMISGPSGSGKSTLLNLLGGLDQPSSGEVLLDGRALGALRDNDLTALRRSRIGFIFQFFNLLPTLTAVENAALPLVLGGWTRAKAHRRATEILREVGLGERTDHFPDQLSGGEQQRVAISRALAYNPGCILADEPTGNLDQATGREILDLLRDRAKSYGAAVVVVTHDPGVRNWADRVLRISDGRVLSDERTAAGA